MTTMRRLQSILVVLLLAMTPATGLFAMALGNDNYVATLDDLVLPRTGSRALTSIIDTTVDDFTNGTHDMTMPVDTSGGELQMKTLLSLGSPITGDHGIFSLTEGDNGTIYAGGMDTGQMIKVDPGTNRVSAVNGSNQMVGGENFISALATGTDGTIWGGTGNGYVFRMDPSTEQVTILNSSNPVDAGSFIASLAVLSNGTIWGSSMRPIVFEIDTTTDTVTTFGNFGGSIPGEVRAVIADNNDDLWVGCTDGNDAWATQIDTVTHSAVWDGVTIVGDSVSKVLVEAPDGTIWGATEGGTTMFQIDPAGPMVTNFGNPTAGEGDTTSLTIGPNGHLWGGTRFAAHIYQVDLRSGLSNDHGSYLASNNVAIRSMMTASDGTIWGGTQTSSGDGEIFRFSPFMWFAEPVSGDSWISAMTLGADGKIYGATQDDMNLGRGSLMFRYDPATDTFSMLNGGNPMVGTNVIPALTTGLDGVIWGGVEPSGEVFYYNTSTQGLNYANGSNPITLDGVSTLATGTDGTIWGGTLGGHVFRIDPSDGSAVVLNNNGTILNGGGIVFDLAVAPDGTIWGGEQNLGKVISIDPSDNSVTDWGQAVTGQNMVFAITVGSDNKVYGSTFDIGQPGHVFELNPANGTFTDLGVPITIPGAPIIYSMEADGRGLVWGSTIGPGRLFTLDEYTNTIVDGPGPRANYTSITSLVPDLSGDIWGATQSNRFGGDNTAMFRFMPHAMYTSVEMDLGDTSRIRYLNFTESSGLTNVSYFLQMRSAPTQGDLQTALWGPWTNLSGQDPSVADNRWAQYRVIFTKLDTGMASSAIIDHVEVSFKQLPVMTAEKVVDKTMAKRGEEITYTLHFNNTGPVTAANVYVNDTLDPSLILLSSSDEANRTDGSWSYPAIPPGTFNNITITARINSSAVAGNVINNSFALDYTDTDGEGQVILNSNTVSTTVQEIDFPDILITKTVDLTEAYPGDQLVYNITLNNTDTGLASNVSVIDDLDPLLEVIDVAGAVSGTAPTWNMGDIVPGEEKVLTITVLVNDTIDVDMNIRNNATVNYTSMLGDPMIDQVSNTVVTLIKGGPAPKLTVSKEVNSTKAEPGGSLRYLITINNTGNDVATMVTVTDTLSTDLSFVNSSDEYNRTDDTWTFNGLAAGSDLVLEIFADVNGNVLNGTVVPNSATVEYSNSTTVIETLITNTVSTTVLTTYKPVLTLQKVVDKAIAAPGEEINYTIYFNNTGSAPAAWVALDEALPSTYVLFQSTSHPYITPYRWNFSNVGPGTHILTITALVKDDVPRDTVVVNTILLSYADADGNYIGDLQASVTMIVRGGSSSDTTNPTVIGISPFRSDIFVSVDAHIEVVFSEPMDKVTAENALRISPSVTGNISWDGNKLIFTPDQKLPFQTTYTVRVMVTAQDLAGNPLAQEYAWTFKTRAKDIVPDDQENITCYIITALIVGLVIGAVIFFIAYRAKFKELEAGPRADKGPVEDEAPEMEGGEPTEDESDIEELEVEAGAGPEKALSEEDAEAEDEPEEEDEPEAEDEPGPEDEEEPEPEPEEEEEVIEEEPDQDEPEGNVEDEEHEEPPPEERTEEKKDAGSLDDILKKLKD